MRISMIGTGYVALATEACLADFGHKVTCIDKDDAKIAPLHDDVMPILEPPLNYPKRGRGCRRIESCNTQAVTA